MRDSVTHLATFSSNILAGVHFCIKFQVADKQRKGFGLVVHVVSLWHNKGLSAAFDVLLLFRFVIAHDSLVMRRSCIHFEPCQSLLWEAQWWMMIRCDEKDQIRKMLSIFKMQCSDHAVPQFVWKFWVFTGCQLVLSGHTWLLPGSPDQSCWERTEF